MTNYILGSGLLALLAKKLLGRDWKIIPYGRSRFYSFNPALDDNYIIRDERLDDFIGHVGGRPTHLYKISYSYQGGLHQSPELCEQWLRRIFGLDLPAHLPPLLRARTVFTVYDIRANVLYENLLNEYMPDIKESLSLGNPVAITPEQIKFSNTTLPYGKIVSTIPFPLLAKLLGKKIELPVKQVWFHHIQTSDLNFEGANQARIVDDYSFFKCSQLSRDRFLFYSFEDIPTPGPYFAQFMRSFDILDGTTIENCIPAGDLPDMSWLHSHNIECVGSSANWDWGLDTASAIIRLLKQH